MSTSSGRKGFCTRCGHSMDTHARSAEAKCKKCKKVFDICQTGYHGQEGYSPRGWRICYVPCNCGEQHYPDKVKAARPLQPHEYIPSHPGYRALEEEESFVTADATDVADISGNADITEVDDGSGVAAEATTWPNASAVSTSDAGPSNLSHQRTVSEDSLDPLQWSPGRTARETTTIDDLAQEFDQVQLGGISSNDSIYINTSVRHGRIRFRDEEGREYRTNRDNWTSSTVDFRDEFQEAYVPCFVFIDPSSGRCYYTWTLGDSTQGEGSSRRRRR